MKIFYISAIEQNASWGAEVFVNRALRQLGHDTHTLDFRAHRWRLSRRFLEVPEFHALLLQRGDYFPLDLLRACRRPRFFWASELVARRRDQDALLESGLFRHVFVRTPACRRSLIDRSWLSPSDVSVLLSAYDERLHRRLPDVEKTIDVLFLGSMTSRRQKILRHLSSRFNVDVRSAFGEQTALLYNASKIVLNIHAEDHLDTETRVFEALGCSAFVLSEPLSEESPFEPGVDLAVANGIAPLEEALCHFLSHEEDRARIAEQGYRAAQRHTYAARARQIAEVIAQHVPVGPPAGSSIDRGAVRVFRRREPGVNVARLARTVPARVFGRLQRLCR